MIGEYSRVWISVIVSGVSAYTQKSRRRGMTELLFSLCRFAANGISYVVVVVRSRAPEKHREHLLTL